MNTKTKTVNIDDIDDLFTGIDADNTVVSEIEKEEVQNSFKNQNVVPDVHINDIDTPKEQPVENETPSQNVSVDINNPTVSNEVAEIFEDKTEGDFTKKETKELKAFFKSQIESGEMFPFSEYDETKQTLDEYLDSFTSDDYRALQKANLDAKEEELRNAIPKQFYDSLPDDAKKIFEYMINGGTDLKKLVSMIGGVKETQKLDPNADSKSIVEQYLTAINYGTDEEIKQQIEEWEDSQFLDKKANEFKPKLEAIDKGRVELELQKQKQERIAQEENARNYQQMFINGVDTDLNGLQLTNNKRAELLDGMLNPSYTSITGKRTNKLGHLLEKYQYIEPNPKLISEALWLLSNPEEYRQSLIKKGESQQNINTVRTLKTNLNIKPTTSTPSTINKNNNMNKPRSIFNSFTKQ